MGISRQTPTVKQIWSTFEKTDNAYSVVDLVEMHRKKMNKTTVYRILDRFEQEGKLHAFIGRNGLKWYAKCHECSSHTHVDIHPHFQCNECGSVKCLDVNIPIPPIKDHRIQKANLLLLGQCEDCIQ